MKRLYWRPPGISRTALVLVATVAALGLVAVELLPQTRKQERYAEKVAAARLAKAGMEAIKAEKQRRGYEIDPDTDPAGTGMIGQSITPVTSNTGFLSAKRTSTNPNFAAVVVHMLTEVGVAPGDVVAVGVSGSFPALNVSTYAALKTLEVEPLVIASVASSEWGANLVDYVWIDMERTLRDRGIIPFKSAGVTYGAIDDLGVGLTDKGRGLLDAAIRRNGVRNLDPVSLSDSIDKRMALYDELAGNRPIRAYINVGGGSASVGTHVGKKQFEPGVNTTAPPGKVPDSVMLRFVERDVPVIHVSRLRLIAERHKLTIAPDAEVPVGEGGVYVAEEYNLTLAGGALATIAIVMLAFLRFDVGARFLRGLRARENRDKTPEQMV